MAQATVQVEKLVKRYPLFFRRRERLQALFGLRQPSHCKVALDEVSFNAFSGQATGIIGENGSGKSTLLRVVAGISRPDMGEVRVEGPVAAILELGLGFHPEFTGRENALLYGSLLGLPPASAAERLPAILAFADLGAFADQPLRTYSSGMAARLAFAVATHVEPRVLVVDEALAVGDGAFQKKCVDRMLELKARGTTILFCSHSLYLVSSFCEQALWLREGRVAALGAARDVVEAYEAYLAEKNASSQEKAPSSGPLPQAAPRPRLLGLETEPPVAQWQPGQGLLFRLRVRAPVGSPPFHLGVSLDAMDERCVFFASTHWDGLPPLKGDGEPWAAVEVGELPLGNGRYWVNAFVFDDTGLVVWDRLRLPTPLQVRGNRWDPSLLRLPHRWTLP